MEILDERGNECPLPIVHTRKKIKEMKPGDVLTVKVSKAVQVENLRGLAEEKGFPFETKQNGDNDYDVILTIKEVCESCNCNKKKEIVVVVSSKTMGSGDDTLGTSLMKAFIFAVSKQDELPTSILFYNSGVNLTTEGSDSLDDLKAMEEAGVNILSCGTCLDFYGLKEKLKVGKITNMYDIVGIIESANVVVKP